MMYVLVLIGIAVYGIVSLIFLLISNSAKSIKESDEDVTSEVKRSNDALKGTIKGAIKQEFPDD